MTEAGVVMVVVDMVMMGMVVVDMAMTVMEDTAVITWEDMVMIMAAMDMLLTVVSSSMEVVRCHHREGVVLPVADHISDVTLYSKLYTPLQAKQHVQSSTLNTWSKGIFCRKNVENFMGRL